MLSCLFGRCSSETYVVTQFPKTNTKKTEIVTNGVPKIVPILPEPTSPTKVEPSNKQNIETVTSLVSTPPQPVQQNGQSNRQDKETIPPSAPKNVPNEDTENRENKIHIETDNSDINKSVLKENNTPVTVKTRPQAPQPPEVKVMVSPERPLDLVTPEQHTSVVKKTEPSKKENSQVSVELKENLVTSASVINLERSEDGKKEKVEGDTQNKKIDKVEVKVEMQDEKKNKDKINIEIQDRKKNKDTIKLETQDQNENKDELQIETQGHKHDKYKIKVEGQIDLKNKEELQDKINIEIQDRKKDKDTIKLETQDQKENKDELQIETQGHKHDEYKIKVEGQIDKKDKEELQDKKKVKGKVNIETEHIIDEQKAVRIQDEPIEVDLEPIRRRSGVVPLPVKYDENIDALPHYLKDPDDEALIKSAIESNDFLNKIISGKRLDDVISSMYNKEIAAKETIIKQGEKGSHMYISAKGKYQVLVKGKVVSEFDDVRVFGELAILYNAKRLASIKALTPGRVWVLDRSVFQQIMIRYNIKEQDEIMLFLMNNETLNVVGKDVLQEVASLLKPEIFSPGRQIVRQGDKGHKFYIIRAGTVTITKEGEGVVGVYKKGDCFGELALLKEDSRQATVTANAPLVECLTLTRKEFIDYFGEVDDITKIQPRHQNSIKDAVAEHADINLSDLKIITTLGVGGFGRVELVQHRKKEDLVFALKYLKKIDIVLQHQQEHVYNEKNIQMSSKSPFIIRLYRTYRDNKYIYFLMESCLGGDLWSLLQKQKLRRFEEKEARFIAACVLEAFDYLHSRGIVYRDLKPENLLIAANGYIKLTDFGFAKKISSRGKTYTFAGTPEYVAPEIVLNKGHDRAVDYWAFGAFIFELLTGRTPFRTDDTSHMKTYNKILNGNIQFPSYVNLKARHIIEKLCRPIPAERLGMQRGGIKDVKLHKWFLGWDWQKFAKCEIPSPFKPKLKSPIDTHNFEKFKKDTDDPPEELSGWDMKF